MHTAFAQAVFGASTAVTALPAAMTKKAGTVDDAPAPVANTSKALVVREAKALKECFLMMAASCRARVLVA